jgi:hypothetical protein
MPKIPGSLRWSGEVVEREDSNVCGAKILNLSQSCQQALFLCQVFWCHALQRSERFSLQFDPTDRRTRYINGHITILQYRRLKPTFDYFNRKARKISCCAKKLLEYFPKTYIGMLNRHTPICAPPRI